MDNKGITKLTDLDIDSVDFVDQGANQKADIVLLKRKEENMENENPIKKFLSGIAKALGMDEEETKNAITSIAKSDEPQGKSAEPKAVEIQKGQPAMTFSGAQGAMNRQQFGEKLWQMNDALRLSLRSIAEDANITDKTAMMAQSVDEFASAMKGVCELYFGDNAKSNTVIIASVKSKEGADDIDDVTKSAGQEPPAKEEGEKDMNIDKSKLTADEAAQLDELMKKAGMVEEPEQPVEKGMFDGLAPELVAMFKSMQEKLQEQEDAKLLAKAKEYELLGFKPEELVKSMKDWQNMGEDCYKRQMSFLDQSLSMAKKSGLFSEIGKRGMDDTSSAWDKIEKKADEILAADPKMSRFAAIDKACEMNPELVKEYEANR